MKFRISLSQKVLLSIGAIIILALLVILYISKTIVLTSFIRLEEQEALTNVERIQKSIEGQLGNLSSTCGDWAPWDDSRDFMLGKSSNYSTSTLNAPALTNLELNFMIFTDTAGKLFYSIAVDLDKEELSQLSEPIIKTILANKSLLNIDDPKKSRQGLIIVGNQALIVAAQPISNSFYQKPITGTLIMGRYFDSRVIKKIEEQTCLDISLAYNDDLALFPDMAQAASQLSRNKNNIVRILDRNTIAGYTNLYDINGEKYITLKIKMAREIYNHGRKTIHYFMLAIVSVIIVILSVLLFVMQKIVLQPINKLTENFVDVSRNYNANTKLYTDRNDEIGSLARSFDEMMDNLKKRMSELDESQNLVRNIIDTDPAVIFVKDSIGRYLLVNKAMAKMYNSTCEEMIGKTDMDFLNLAISSFEQAYKLIEDDRRVIETQKPLFIAEESFTSPQGITKWTQTYKIPISIKGNPQCVLGIGVDITERKKNEDATNSLNRELVKASERLEQANTELKNFVYIASHDLREPLRKISSFGAMLEKSLADKMDEDEAENLKFMIDGAYRMTKMVEGLLVYSRVSTQAQPFQTIDLNEIVKQLSQLELAIILEESKADLQIPQPLPCVSADPVQIRQLMQNLIANAIKYQKKRNKPVITITSRPASGGMVRIEVTDNGIGIKPELQGTLFVMFKRLHSRTEYEGTGIGLAVCRKIVEQHGGKIGLESQQDKGSTFWFTLPFVSAAIPAQV